MNKLPDISFVCPTYNHEKYVGFFIESILNQSISNWELIIIDDRSIDNTVLEINKYKKDERIVFIQNAYNKGCPYGVTLGVSKARGNIISLVASDDIVMPDYAEKILNRFSNSSVDVLYVSLQYIDEYNEVLPGSVILEKQFSQTEIIRRMFLFQNELPSPGIAVKKHVFKNILPLDMGLAQTSDYQYNIFFLFHYSVGMVQKPLIQYRRLNSSQSSPNKVVNFRYELEITKLMNTFVRLIGGNVNTFLACFGSESIIQNKKIHEKTISFWLGMLATQSPHKEKRRWGLQTIMNFISSEENLNLVYDLYEFSY